MNITNEKYYLEKYIFHRSSKGGSKEINNISIEKKTNEQDKCARNKVRDLLKNV